MSTKKDLQNYRQFARIMGNTLAALGIIFLGLGLVDMVNGESFASIAIFIGGAVSSLAFSAIILVLSAIAGYYSDKIND